MDTFSHGLIGSAIGQYNGNSNLRKIGLIGLIAMLPDIFQIPYYLVLGYIKNRPFFIPYNEDWVMFRGQFPILDLLWDIPHSLLFLIIVVIPIVKFYRLNNILIISYLSHIVVDILTHTGEWNVKFLFPFNLSFDGFTDAWVWSFSYISISWLILIIINITQYQILKNKSKL